MAPRIATVVVLALLAAAAPAAAQGGPKASQLITSKQVGIGATSFVVTCPRGYVAAAGAFAPTPPTALSVSSGPVAGATSQWSFGVVSTQAATVRVVVRCVKLAIKLVLVKKGPGGVAKIKATTKAGAAFLLNPGSTKGVAITCPKGAAPVGPGAQVGPSATGKARSALAGSSAGLTFYESMPVRGGWRFGVRNDGAFAQRVKPKLRCIDRDVEVETRRGRRLLHRFRVLRRSFQVNAAPGTTPVTERCGRRQLSLATGWSFSPRTAVVVLGAHPDKRRELRLRFGSQQGGTQKLDAFALCLDLATRFEPR